MKQLLLSSTFSLASLFAIGQANNYPNGSTVADFTVTDTEGATHNLSTYTYAGKYVVLDFFFYNCGPCQANAPYYSQLYETYGCNEGDLICVSIDNGDDTDALTEQFSADFGGPWAHPPAVGSGGGEGLTTTFGVSAFPTFCLIGPGNIMIVNDIWPITAGMNTFVNAFPTGSGITPQACAVGIQEPMFNGGLKVFPSVTSGSITVDINVPSAAIASVEVVDMLGRRVQSLETHGIGSQTFDLGMLGTGQYHIRLIADGVVVDAKRITIAR